MSLRVSKSYLLTKNLSVFKQRVSHLIPDTLLFELYGSIESFIPTCGKRKNTISGEYQTLLDEDKRQKEYNNNKEENKFFQEKFDNDSADYTGDNIQDSDDYDTTEEEKERKIVRVRVPVVRSRNGRQHARTVVRRRPLVSYTKNVESLEVNSHAPRRIVVTRVRTLGPIQPSGYGNELSNVDFQASEVGRHKVTITRRRKIRPTTTLNFNRERITRKKLVNVRPIPQPSPTLAIITTGFYTAPSEDEDDSEFFENEEISNVGDANVYTPKLHETPNTIENKPVDANDNSDSSKKFESNDAKASDKNTPVIITDNFFFPASQDDFEDDDEDNNYKNDDDYDKSKIETTSPYPTNDDEFVTERHESTSMTKPSKPLDVNIQSEEKDETPAKLTNENSPKKEVLPEMSNVFPTTDFPCNESSTSQSDSTPYDDVPTTFNPLNINDIPQIEKSQATINDSTGDIRDQLYFSNATFDDNTTSVQPEAVNTGSEIYSETYTSTISDETTIPLDTTTTDNPPNDTDDILTVKPLETYPDISFSDEVKEGRISSNEDQFSDLQPSTLSDSDYFTNYDDSDIPSVIPLDTKSSYILENHEIKIPLEMSNVEVSPPGPQLTTTFTSPTPEDIEAGLADDLYLSLSRPDFPQISPSKPLFDSVLPSSRFSGPVVSTPELKTSVYYTETIVTSTRLRTYTYVVTKLNGLETEVTSSTSIRPRVTTLTLTVPITVTVTSTAELTSSLVTSDTNLELVTGEYPFHTPRLT